VIELFEGLGLQVRAERDGCAFPGSGRAVRVRDALLGEARHRGVTILYGRRVEEVLRKPGLGFLIKTAHEVIQASRVILATGGLSYPQTGSTGHGLQIAQSLGHTIVQPRPALVPLVTAETWPGHLAGVSIGSATVTAKLAGRRICQTGALLFTRDGIGGPVVLNLSRDLTELLPNAADPVKISIDLLPAHPEDGLERQVLRWAQVHPRKALAGQVADLVPRRLAEVLTRQAGCPGDLRISHLSKENRRELVRTLKALELHIVATRPMAEATITRGGVATDQIDPKTMQSRLCLGLFFTGEVLDVDGPCGGYNLQVCWSTGALAGISAG